MKPDFDELVGADLAPDERARLLRAHEALVAAGAPPELPPSLLQAPGTEPAEVVPFFNRRRHAAIAVLAAALALAAFGVGYLAGHNGGSEEFAAQRSLGMRATAAAPDGAIGSLTLGDEDKAGNRPMIVRVSNLKELPPRGYYNVYLTRDGRPVAPCGSFVVSGTTTEVSLNVPYPLKRFDGWAITLQPPGVHEPGRVVLHTV
jgi:hypothetical protein